MSGSERNIIIKVHVMKGEGIKMKVDQGLSKSKEGLKNICPLYLVFLFLPIVFTSIIMRSTNNMYAPFGSQVVYAFCNWIVLFFLFIYLKRRDLVKEVFQFSKFKYKEFIAAIVTLLIGLFVVYPLVNYTTSLIGIPMKGMNFKISNGFIFAIVSFFAVITAPFVEEVLFRGFGLGYFLAKGFSPVVSGIITILLFSLIHIPYFGLGGAIFIAFWSTLPTYLRLRYDNLTPGWLMHLLNNFFAFIIVVLFLS